MKNLTRSIRIQKEITLVTVAAEKNLRTVMALLTSDPSRLYHFQNSEYLLSRIVKALVSSKLSLTFT